MATPGKPERRGGYRPNAGRKPSKPESLTTAQVRKLLRKVKKYSKRYGKDPDDVLLDIVYGANERKADVLAAIKLLKEYTVPKITEGGDADKALGPALFLPEQRPPELAVVHGEKAEAA